MKYNTLFILLLFLVACGSPEKKEELPTDLKGKKALLTAKKADLAALKSEIKQLEEEIETLDPNSKRTKKKRIVATTLLEKKDFKHYVEIQGSVQSDKMVKASSEIGGRLISLTAEEGSFVKKGSLIGKVDLEAISKQMGELQIQLDLANTVYQRQSRLWDQKIGSELQLLQAKNNVDRLNKTLETLRFQQSKANVYAPISGTVDRVFIKAGEMTAPGSPILQILNLGTVKVVADVPENYLQSVKRGETVTVKFPALEEERKARVSLLGQMINPTNRTFSVEINMSNKGSKLKPNLLANVLINDFSEKNAIVIASELIQQEVSGRDFVYIIEDGEEGKKATKKYIDRGESYEGETVIKSGLEGTETLITDGARMVADGDLIQIQGAKEGGLSNN